MTNYLLCLILLTLCLGGVPLDGKVKQILYIVLALLGLFVLFGGTSVAIR